MKAGRAGSIPDGATTSAGMSPPLRIFLQAVGETVFSLNTAVVGFDAVEHGHPKPATLDISWDPADRIAAARKSRRFVLRSVLVHVSEAVGQYYLAMARTHRLSDIASQWTKDDGIADRIYSLCKELLPKDALFLMDATLLLVHWRNRVVHTGSRARLSGTQARRLQSQEQQIREQYKALDVTRLLDDFEGDTPSLKDISSLVAMAINCARMFDRAVHTTLNKSDLDHWLEFYEVVPLLKRTLADTAPNKRAAAIARVIRTWAPALTPEFDRYYGNNLWMPTNAL